VAGERFDLVVCNPPYVPSGSDMLPRHSLGRCWDAGRDGRAVLDRFCQQVPSVLAPGKTVLVMHSNLTDEAETMDRLAARGLQPCIEASVTTPFGPVMRARASRLVQRGLLDAGRAHERLVVVSARLADHGDPR